MLFVTFVLVLFLGALAVIGTDAVVDRLMKTVRIDITEMSVQTLNSHKDDLTACNAQSVQVITSLSKDLAGTEASNESRKIRRYIRRHSETIEQNASMITKIDQEIQGRISPAVSAAATSDDEYWG